MSTGGRPAAATEALATSTRFDPQPGPVELDGEVHPRRRVAGAAAHEVARVGQLVAPERRRDVALPARRIGVGGQRRRPQGLVADHGVHAADPELAPEAAGDQPRVEQRHAVIGRRLPRVEDGARVGAVDEHARAGGAVARPRVARERGVLAVQPLGRVQVVVLGVLLAAARELVVVGDRRESGGGAQRVELGDSDLGIGDRGGRCGGRVREPDRDRRDQPRKRAAAIATTAAPRPRASAHHKPVRARAMGRLCHTSCAGVAARAIRSTPPAPCP